MFRKLKLQFILPNLAIIIGLFVFLITGAYYLLQIKMINNSEFFAKRLAAGVNSGIFPELPTNQKDKLFRFNDIRNRRPPLNFQKPFEPPKPPESPSSPQGQVFLPAVFFIKTDSTGEILFQSPPRPLDQGQLHTLVGQVVKAGKNTGIINIIKSKYFYYKTSLSKEPGTLIVFQDLRQGKRIQRSLVLSLLFTGFFYLILTITGSLFMAKRAITPIQTAWRQQKEFLADASHELRTPLAVIQTNLEVVLSNPDETVASQRPWLNNIQEELQQTTALVSSLLFLAKADSAQTILNKTNFALDKILTSTVEAFKPIASEKNITIKVETSREIICYGEQSAIRQVIEGLLDNALRYTPDGGEISLKLTQSNKKIQLTVADNGEGIAAEHLEKIFDRFYQVDASRSKGKAGLGLSIAKCIIEKHGGTIRAVSQPGSGTTFIIQLPLPKNKNIMKNEKGANTRTKTLNGTTVDH